jgi:hypothetical protein
MAKYVIASKAREIAGFRNPGVGKVIELTDEQAAHPLRIGHIAVPEQKPAAPVAAKEKADK